MSPLLKFLPMETYVINHFVEAPLLMQRNLSEEAHAQIGSLRILRVRLMRDRRIYHGHGKFDFATRFTTTYRICKPDDRWC